MDNPQTPSPPTIAVLNHMGTSHSDPCNRLGKEIWKWCIDRDIWLSAAHIPGVHNIKADFESRRSNNNMVWMVDRAYLNNALSHLSLRPNIDLFASWLNNQFPQCESFKPDPGAVAVDAFSLNLHYLKLYAFPPFNVINAFLQRVREDQASGILIIPNWLTSLVSPSYADVCGAADNSQSSQTPPPTTRETWETRETTSTSQNPNATSMPLVREQLQNLGLSPDTIDILMASWRKSTGKQYATYLSRGVTYCKNKQLVVTHATINDGLDFLTLLYKKRVGYSAINTARSALSLAITPADKTTFGEHPLITRFLKATFELRPSLPRYSTMWDVGIVLTYFRSFPLATWH